jgi:hypothetical protein
MRYLSPIIAASVVAILAYSIFFKKNSGQVVPRKIEIGTISEAPAPVAPAPLARPAVMKDASTQKQVMRAPKSKPRSFRFAKRRNETSGPSLAAVTGMTPAASEYNLTPADEDQTLRPKNSRNMVNPADSRWINELSGQRAKLKMGVSRTDLNCDQDYRQCERPQGGQEVLVGGMVVKSERLMKNPADAMDGELVRGHYVRKTPAVYVK